MSKEQIEQDKVDVAKVVEIGKRINDYTRER